MKVPPRPLIARAVCGLQLSDATFDTVDAKLDLYRQIVDATAPNLWRLQMARDITMCGRCGVSVTKEMRFCPGCGRGLEVRSGAFYRTIGLTAVGIFAVGMGLKYAVQPGQPPKGDSIHSAPHVGQQEIDDPQLKAMRREVEAAPNDLSKLRVYAGMLGDKLRSNPDAPQEMVFEAIDVLSRILSAEPNDPGALVMMADLSFDQKAFTKAADFYQRYLKLEPQDLGARARYASTLTFLGRYDESVVELRAVLKEDPKNFPAMAYLAITYAQSGDLPKAKETGNSALALAPSEDARARFSAFVSSLDEAQADQGVSSSPSRNNTGQPQSNVPAAEVSGKGIEGFIATVRANPVAGPKFMSYETGQKGTLRLLFRNFPMQAMPPFAKEKFFSGLKKAAADNTLEGVSTLAFIDADTGAEMDAVSIP